MIPQLDQDLTFPVDMYCIISDVNMMPGVIDMCSKQWAIGAMYDCMQQYIIGNCSNE